MLRKVIVSHDATKMEFDLFEPSDIYVKKIDGLGPVDVDIATSDYTILDGSVFNTARLHNRNIVFYFGYLDEGNIIALRQKLYSVFASKKHLKMEFVTDSKTVYIMGYLETFNPDIFSENATVQISIVCEDPLFKAIASEVVNFDDRKDAFEFPFSNESLTEPLLETSILEIKDEVSVYYNGEYETGFEMNVHIKADIDNLTIFKNFPDSHILVLDNEIITKSTGAGLTAGDVIKISTGRNNKKINLLRNGITYNILNAANKNITWPLLLPGDNLFGYTTTDKFNVVVELIMVDVYVGI